MYLVETHNLTKKYKNKVVINNVNMHISMGSIYGFVGENGSGKTTIMRLLCGLVKPTNGTYSLFGINSKDKKINNVRKNIAAIVENVSLIGTLSAFDNIIYHEKYSGIKLTQDERLELLKRVNLDDVGNKKVRNFSLGMRQRLGIALALLNKPKLLLLDEPMNGLDPEGIAELRDLLLELSKKEKITILISSHILSELEKIATDYGFISNGILLEELTASELSKKGKKSIILKLNDYSKTNDVFSKLNIKDYKLSSNGEIQIFDDVSINDIVTTFDKAKVAITSLSTIEESVEDYYLKLVKGAK